MDSATLQDDPSVESFFNIVETAPTKRSTGTTTCWPQRSCQSLRITRETPTTRKTLSTGSKIASPNTAETCSWSIPRWMRRTTAV